MKGKLEDKFKGQWPRHLSKLTHAYNNMVSCNQIFAPLPHVGQQPRLPINFVFLTHEVMGTLRPVDNYVAELISALRKSLQSHM